ncbi:MAG: gamma-glutamyltransferase [Planctomycetes bacterium]|nr:gamma-glutamyltransferase [Planctomycetota bacterium]
MPTGDRLPARRARRARHRTGLLLVLALPLLATVLAGAGCVRGLARREPLLDRGCVAAAEPRAAEVGAAILRRGGNAVDAAVAVFFALAVTFPNAGNLGGGGFMLVHAEGRGDAALDYREAAPARAHPDLYLDPHGQVVPGLSLDTHLAAGVPGAVRGMWEAHRRYGSLPWKVLLAPAIELAQGFVVDERSAKEFAKENRNNFAKYFHVPAGQPLAQPELAATLRRIADEGPDDFYRGCTARLLIAEMRRGNGILTLEDLAAYRAVWRKPIEGSYRGRRVVSMPPPSSGGVALLQLLNMAETFSLPKRDTPEYVHLVAEIEKRVYADRSHFLGDPDFWPVPVPRLIDKGYARERVREISLDRKTDPASIGPGRLPPAPERMHTTHFSVADRWGNAVANTTTLNDSFGSGIVVEGAGFLLNNEMDDFSAKPGARNLFGVTGGEANRIEAGKRPLSSMSPTFVYSPEGRLQLVLGSPGGPTIITTVFQVIANRLDHGLELAAAVAAPRFHHQWPPPEGGRDLLSAEEAMQVDALAKWYDVKRRSLGDVQAVEVRGRTATAVSDPRGRGGAATE